MKKAYKKPEIMFESFASSVNIALNCEAIVDGPNSGYCGFDRGEGVGILFLDMLGSECTGPFAVTPELNKHNQLDGEIHINFGTFNSLCYHVPNNANLFNS